MCSTSYNDLNWDMCRGIAERGRLPLSFSLFLCLLSFSLLRSLRLVDNKGERPLPRRETAVGRRWRDIGPQGERDGQRLRGKGGQAEKRDAVKKKRLPPGLCSTENRRLYTCPSILLCTHPFPAGRAARGYTTAAPPGRTMRATPKTVR